MLKSVELNANTIVEYIAGVFESHGDDEYLGEAVTMSEHMLQGAWLAEQQGFDKEIIAGALLHDIGHFVSELGTFNMSDTKDRYHEDAGAVLLEPYFPRRVVDCVRHHVAAKRYLCAVEPEYYAQLSEASRHSLSLQGGPMSEDEVQQFSKIPNLDAVIAVRRLDDAGKVAGMDTPALTHFLPLIQKLVIRAA
ncbi:MAG: HD domain-containing protein [Gammaproteobacteria bacterium]|nr:HD domain-containing protein [Gammaproteobacteria bacterium]